MNANGSALDLVAEAIEDFLGCCAFYHAVDLASDSSSLGTTRLLHHLSTSSGSLRLSRLLRGLSCGGHLRYSSGRLTALSIVRTIVAVATAEAEG